MSSAIRKTFRRSRAGWRPPPALLVVAALLLPAVRGAQADSSGDGLVKLTLSYSEKTVDMLPLMIASDAGYFRKNGLDVTLQYLPAQQGVPALLTDQVQIAAIGGSDALSAQAQGAKLKFVLTLSPVYTFEFWALPQHATAAGLKGQHVGVTSMTGSLYSGTLLALKELGLSPSDVVLAPLGSAINVNNALMAGSIVAGCSHPPATYQFKQNGFVKLVDLPQKRIPSVNAGILATASYIQSNPKLVHGVVDAVLQGLGREAGDKAYAESEISKHFRITDQAELDYTYDFYAHDVLAPGPQPTIAQLQSNQKALSATNPKVNAVDVAAMIDPSFLKQAQR